MPWIIGGAAVLGAGIGAWGGNKTNSRNKKIAREQMRFQERMSSTAYQRAMEDMRKAGLNPMLAFSQGGASTPGGVSIPAINAVGAGVETGLGIFNSGMAASQTQSNIEKQDAEVDKIVQEIENLSVSQELTKAQITQVAWVVYDLRASIDLKGSQAMGIDYDNIVKSTLSSFYQSNEYAAILKDLGIDGRTLGNLLNTLFGVGALKGLMKGKNADKVGELLKQGL